VCYEDPQSGNALMRGLDAGNSSSYGSSGKFGTASDVAIVYDPAGEFVERFYDEKRGGYFWTFSDHQFCGRTLTDAFLASLISGA
jgi:hypothetical protein